MAYRDQLRDTDSDDNLVYTCTLRRLEEALEALNCTLNGPVLQDLTSRTSRKYYLE
jgi:hypothetical protein